MASAPNFLGESVRAYVRARVSIEDRAHSSQCWIWQRALKPDGYAVGYPFGKSSPKRMARVAYEAFVGPIPIGLEIDHLCRQRSCCNPEHLEPVTREENIARGVAARVVCRRGHAFSAGNTIINSNGARTCRACKADSDHARWLRRSAAA